MHIRKYDFDYGRRALLEKTAKGVAAGGVLAPIWPMIANADTPDVSKAFPEELTSIEVHTKGKIKPGDVVTADNVEHVAHLLDPIALKQVQEMGRRIKIKESTQNVDDLFETPFLEATLRNRGKAIVGKDQNIWYEKEGEPWKGGVAFTDPEDGYQALANGTLSWGRHDYSQYAIPDWDIAPDGSIAYQYDFVWSELQVTGRPDGKVFKDQKDKTRYQSVWFTAPNEQSGTSFLSTWYYDQRKFPDLIGYLPAFKRVREYPSSQRFEPLVPGVTFFLSDAWAAGDPLATWGNYKIIERKPMLGAIQDNWYPEDDNWLAPTHGGPKGNTFWDTTMELVPECIVMEAEPTQYPRSPVGKKRVWIDVRNQEFLAYVTYDRKGDIWKSFEPALSKYKTDKHEQKTGKGHTLWTWTGVMSHDVQTGRMSRIRQAKEVAGGYKSAWDNDHEVDVYNKYLTSQAMRRLGA